MDVLKSRHAFSSHFLKRNSLFETGAESEWDEHCGQSERNEL